MKHKILFVPNELVIALFRQDASKQLQFDGMPDDARLIAVSSELAFDKGQIAFKIESDSFPDTPDGEALPTLVIQVHEIKPETKRGREWL